MRGATGGPPQGRGKTRHFNPRTPRGVRLDKRHLEPPPELEFQSTRPVRGATRPGFPRYVRHQISIHAPRAGRDADQLQKLQNKLDISIHAPRAGRDRRSSRPRPSSLYFNPRAPCGARRGRRADAFRALHISIHAPRAGRDVRTSRTGMCLGHFNPRAPCGARRACSWCAALA